MFEPSIETNFQICNRLPQLSFAVELIKKLLRISVYLLVGLTKKSQIYISEVFPWVFVGPPFV